MKYREKHCKYTTNNCFARRKIVKITKNRTRTLVWRTARKLRASSPWGLLGRCLMLALFTQSCVQNGPEVKVGDELIAGTVSYKNHIQPIFNAYCSASCHLKSSAASGGLNLSDYNALMNGGNSGPAIIPTSSSTNLLIKRLSGAILPLMPSGGEPFTPNQIKNISNWIDQGANNN